MVRSVSTLVFEVGWLDEEGQRVVYFINAVESPTDYLVLIVNFVLLLTLV